MFVFPKSVITLMLFCFPKTDVSQCLCEQQKKTKHQQQHMQSQAVRRIGILASHCGDVASKKSMLHLSICRGGRIKSRRITYVSTSAAIKSESTSTATRSEVTTATRSPLDVELDSAFEAFEILQKKKAKEIRREKKIGPFLHESVIRKAKPVIDEITSFVCSHLARRFPTISAHGESCEEIARDIFYGKEYEDYEAEYNRRAFPQMLTAVLNRVGSAGFLTGMQTGGSYH